MSSRASEIKVNVLTRADTPSLESMINAQGLKATLVYLGFPQHSPNHSYPQNYEEFPFFSFLFDLTHVTEN